MKSEKEHIICLKQGSAASFDAIYATYHARLYNFVFRLSRGDDYISEEIVQCVFIKLWEIRKTIDENKNLLTYLCTIAKNLFLNNYSHKLVEYVYHEYVMNNGKRADLSTEQEVDRNLLDQLITELTEKLPPARRNIFIMSRREGKSNKEISGILNITESTIETQLGKAVEFLKKEIKKHYAVMYGCAIFFLNFFLWQ